MSSVEAVDAEAGVNTVGHFINGKEVAGTGDALDVFDPASGSISKRVAIAQQEELEQVISAAREAFSAWRQTPPQKRAQILFRFRQLVEQHADEI